MRTTYTLPLKEQSLTLGTRTLVMGIVNVTPDSFSDGGQFFTDKFDCGRAVEYALALAAAGADIIDIGGESTRPGAPPVSAQEELARVLPVIEALAPQLSIPISIDTYKASVAAAALAAGAQIVNDISALKFDQQMATTIAAAGAAVCLMHTRGTPDIMQKLPPSPNIWVEIEDDLGAALTRAEQAGIARTKLIIDPGIGFGKTLTDNLTIIAQLARLQRFDLPILIGTSRKSFIGKLSGNADSDRLMGTAASVTAAILQGAHIVRVHDVAPIVETVRISDAILRYATI